MGPGLGGLVLGDAAVLPAGEHIVGRHMHQPCAGLGRCLGQVAGADGVDLKSQVVAGLAAIHIGKSSAVDDHVRALAADKVIHHLIVGDIQLRQIHRQNGSAEQLFRDGADLAAALPQLLDDLGAKLALAACNDDFHANASLSISICRLQHSSDAGHRGFCRSALRFPAAYPG